MKIFVDSNIPMYAAGRDHPHRAPSLRLLEEIRDGRIEGCTSAEVLQEILYRYGGMQRLDLARAVYENFAAIVPVVYPVSLADTDAAKTILCGMPGVSARDSLHAAVMRNHGIRTIATYDAGFGRIEGVEALAP